MKSMIYVLVMLFAVSAIAQETATDFNLPDLKGENFQLSDHYGDGPILINFWATWCIPCIAEMKKLKTIYKKYEADGLQILSISIDDPKTVSKVKGFVKSNRYPFTILLDTNNEVFRLYNGTNPPLSLLIDYEGRVVYNHVGYRKGDEKKLDEIIGKMIAGHKAKGAGDVQD